MFTGACPMSRFSPDSPFAGLSPDIVWKHFARLCATPRPSKGEGPLRDALLDWARGRGLAAMVDAAGNLILKKPATSGREGAPGVILQGHLDMVCQKNAGSAHDFSRDPIVPALREAGWSPNSRRWGRQRDRRRADPRRARGRQPGPRPARGVLTVDEEAGWAAPAACRRACSTDA
jgi:dipeptidase D